MNLLHQAFLDLYPNSQERRIFELNYSGKFRGYNGNIRMSRTHITANIGKQWKDVSPEIQKGLLHELLLKLYKDKRHTINMDLYHHFIRQLPNIAPRTHSDPVLEASFARINDQFFAGMMATPNLRWSRGTNLLGTYEYATDTVTISKILLENPTLLDYVMYHELLHKKHQFTSKAGRTTHHSRAFREDERKFPNAAALEKELERLIRRRKLSFW